MNIYEKAGDLFVEIVKLIVGGVILASIISENISTEVLYIVGGVNAAIFVFSGFIFYKIAKRKE